MVKPHDSAEELPFLVPESKSVIVTQKKKKKSSMVWAAVKFSFWKEKGIPVEVE